MSRHRTGARSNRRKRGLIRRFGIVFPAAVIATVAVIAVAVGAKVLAPRSGAFSAVQAIEMVPGSHTMAALEAERAQLIAMTTAARTLTVVAKPKLASPAEVAAANPSTGTSTGSRHRIGWRRSRLRHVHAAQPEHRPVHRLQHDGQLRLRSEDLFRLPA